MQSKEYFIARIYTTNEWGACHYHDEGIFSSYQKAYDYLMHVFKGHYDNWLGEIASYLLDSNDPEDSVKTWTFGKTGELLDSYDAANELEDFIKEDTEDGVVYYKKTHPEQYAGKYLIGDIVFIKAHPWNKHGFPSDVIGVIGQKPVSPEEWISEGNRIEEWDDEYIIYYITSYGFLSHLHIEEEGIQSYIEELPKNLLFLKRLSAHFCGTRKLDKTLQEGIFTENIFVEKVQHLPEEEY